MNAEEFDAVRGVIREHEFQVVVIISLWRSDNVYTQRTTKNVEMRMQIEQIIVNSRNIWTCVRIVFGKYTEKMAHMFSVHK